MGQEDNLNFNNIIQKRVGFKTLRGLIRLLKTTNKKCLELKTQTVMQIVLPIKIK